MEVEGLKPEQFVNCPPLMPWREFAIWIHMGEDQDAFAAGSTKAICRRFAWAVTAWSTSPWW